MIHKLKQLFVLVALCLSVSSCKKDDSDPSPGDESGNSTFTHPGLLHTTSDLEFIKLKLAVNAEPWASSFTAFSSSQWASLTYTMQGPTVVMSRDETTYPGYKSKMENDCYAVYAQALMWKLTDNSAYAENAINILNAWSSTLTGFGPSGDVASMNLVPSFNGFIMVNGAEILRSYSGWKQEDFKRCQDMFRNIFYNTIKGIEVPNAHGTWDGANMKAVMAFGVFLDDEEIFNTAYNYFYNGAGIGTIKNYFLSTGQGEEAGRSQAYAQLGVCSLAEACEIGYNQGKTDMWVAMDSVMKKAFEYLAKYNLGSDDVPYSAFTNVYGRVFEDVDYTKISSKSRGDFRPMYYLAYNHFHNRLGASMPYTKEVIETKQSIEQTNSTVTDGSGWGSLFHYRPKAGDTGLNLSGVGKLQWEFTVLSGWKGVPWAENSTVVVADGQLVISASGTSMYVRGYQASANLKIDSYPYLAIKITTLPALSDEESDWAIQTYWTINGAYKDYRYTSKDDFTKLGDNVYVLKWFPKTDFYGGTVDIPQTGTLSGGLYLDFGNCKVGEVARIDWVRSYATLEEVPTE